jgi:hypothetical protein
MRYTRSQARAQATEEAQTSLLQIAIAQVAATHASSLENLEMSSPLPTILEDAPLEDAPLESVIVSTVVVPSIPSFIRKKTRLPPTGVRGLPIPRLKRR